MDEQSQAALDQSKADDFQTRVFCVQQASVLGQCANGDPLDVIDTAREFYLFLTGQDPVVDVFPSAGNTDNVVYLPGSRMLQDFAEACVEGDQDPMIGSFNE